MSIVRPAQNPRQGVREENPSPNRNPGVRLWRPDPLTADAWREASGRLASWALDHMVNRPDAHGAYRPMAERESKGAVFTAKSPVTWDLLRRHFAGRDVGDVIGL